MAVRIVNCTVCKELSDLLIHHQYGEEAWETNMECVPCLVRRTVREELKKARVTSPAGPQAIIVIEDQ
jgi:hypothetical protein